MTGRRWATVIPDRDGPPAAVPDLDQLFVLPLTLVPPRRLGELLRAHREAAGRTLGDVVQASDGALSPRDLRRLESGGAVPEIGLTVVALAYRIDPGLLVPPRTVVEIAADRRWLSADRLDEPWVLDVDGDMDPTDALILRYLALVYAFRERPVGDRLTLRTADLTLLARHLDRTMTEVGQLAGSLAARHEDELRRLTDDARRRLESSRRRTS